MNSCKTLENNFTALINESTKHVQEYVISDDHAIPFKKFKKEYENNSDIFFQNIDKIETEILSVFCKPPHLFASDNLGKNYLSIKEIKRFIQGEILQKSITNASEVSQIKSEINTILKNNNPVIDAKYLHFLSPKLLKFIYDHRKTFFQPVASLFNKDKGISFEFAYFRVAPGLCNPYWHDDYTIFKNEVINPATKKSLIVNCHLALSNVTSNSSPLCFLKGTEDIVYARSALKFFTYSDIKFNKDLFLKATYLAEKLYIPGRKVKTNFIGLIPNYSYRLHQLQNLTRQLEIFFQEVQMGDFLIFSPNYMHTAAYINTEQLPRESITLRCLEDDYYNYRNIITCEKLTQLLSFALKKIIAFDRLKNSLFKRYDNLNLHTQIYSNIYINKEAHNKMNYKYPRIYLEDLYNFYNENLGSVDI
jgi:ectoine hydroxylase-related dioxygenase (phytanoyl-CoA dioxygenase family)